MRIFFSGILLALVFAGLDGAQAQSGSRVALIIGNAQYDHAGLLRHPISDAEAVAASLKRVGFNAVILQRNLGAQGMREALLAFERLASESDVALVYFAGHGVEIDGVNYLLPTDARMQRAAAVEIEAIPLSTLISQISGARVLKLIILDACRSNPFRNVLMADRSSKRSIGRGLARVEPADDVLVAFAAREGTMADDGGVTERHSPFTTALLKYIERPDLEVRYLFAEIRDEVLERTSKQQTPHLYGTLGRRRIYLSAAAHGAAPVGTLLSTPPTAQPGVRPPRVDVLPPPAVTPPAPAGTAWAAPKAPIVSGAPGVSALPPLEPGASVRKMATTPWGIECSAQADAAGLVGGRIKERRAFRTKCIEQYKKSHSIR